MSTPLVCAHMKRRTAPAAESSELLQDDLSFPPPFHQQSKYLALADMFLCPGVPERTDKKVRSIDTSHYFRKLRKKRSA
jgi:hypothetical protein